LAGTAAFSRAQGGGAKAFYESGVARVKQGDYEGAIVDFDRAIEADGANPSYYAARGNAKTNTGAVDDAIADFTKAITLDPSRRVPYINRGVARLDKGDIEGAVADYTKAISLDPKNAAALSNRGCAKWQKGDVDGARNDFQQALQLATDEGAYPRFYIVLISMKQRAGGAAADVKELREIVSHWKESWKKTVGQFLSGEIDEATLLERAAQGSPKAVRDQKCESYFYAAAVRLLKGDAAGAKPLFEKCVATQLHTFPEFQLARAELAKLTK
jgi:lipoprotein NlpI